MRTKLTVLWFFFCFISLNAIAAKLVEVKVVDKDYLMVSFMDGEVKFVDDGLGSTAYTSDHNTANNYVVSYGAALNTANAVSTGNWVIKSAADARYGTGGVNPTRCWRKSKLNGMAEMDWNTAANDWNYEYTMEHTIYLKLPYSMLPGTSYTVEINPNTNSDVLSRTVTFDIFSSRSEAVHVNLVGYLDDSSVKAVDLYIWMGDGGARDYSSFVGNKVYIYNVDSGTSQEVGTVAFWKNSSTNDVGWYNLTASNVWKADFTGFQIPGTYRIAIEGVGCSEDFQIKKDVYFEPFRVSVLGFFYMRIGQDNLNMSPVPRRPLYIPNVSPPSTRVYITTMSPIHPNWGTFTGGDPWDNPNAWAAYVKPGSPQNNNAYGGHSDALDWDRHLGHISIIYDMLLPYILTDGRLNDDNLGIAESGNGIPDLLDEARNEVDFWLRLRDGDGYSYGLTNPNGSNILYQAGNTPIAAWANAANASMLAYCFMLAGLNDLKETYTQAAVTAYNYASALPDPMLNASVDAGYAVLRGKDLKMTAAVYLYNVTGDPAYEDVVNALSESTTNTSPVANSSFNQLWAVAGYLKTRQPVRYPALYSRMKASLINEAKNVEANNISSRPSRRATENYNCGYNSGYFKTIQNVQRSIAAHAVADTSSDKELFENALVLEADWGLGRNSLNIIYMTTASTSLAGKRSIENAYTSGRDDGTPGLHPGHTPYLNTDDWYSGMIMGRPSWMTEKCYPAYSNWPRAEGYFNTRYVWAHSEFTPQQTMRGKMALYAYLYGLYKTNSVPGDFEPDGDVDIADLVILAGEWLQTENLSADIYPAGGDGVVDFQDFSEFARYWGDE
ncbi:MAG TPA: cellulase N-terminal Ig-like domain-containing protein [Anaerohalosphaeraceae bacterium]|nr:cellulase N-terminal Ig-like domain-containing protein [Anaerohalosphaeraceae bacterium]HOL87944.1 cellulase N-terminal Ig-like domain-containing protein [Anaerohalosphaeraceae bacterium]HPP55443.1 cellulase N-terminal Ig-like domain-containing protein [Anaerohalosphaeraceae bacterium]